MYRTIEPYTTELEEDAFYEETQEELEPEVIEKTPVTPTDKPCSCQDKAPVAPKAWWVDAAITAVTVLAIIALIKMIIK